VPCRECSRSSLVVGRSSHFGLSLGKIIPLFTSSGGPSARINSEKSFWMARAELRFRHKGLSLIQVYLAQIELVIDGVDRFPNNVRNEVIGLALNSA
jgi:hypothetical protein